MLVDLAAAFAQDRQPERAATMAQAALIEALDAGVKPILQCIRDQFAHLRTYARLS
jgi:hypothetical protein